MRWRTNKKIIAPIHKRVVVGGRTIKQYHCIPQYSADCGYHATYNARCLKQNNFHDLLDYKKFKEESAVWKKAVGKARNSKYQGGNTNVDSGEIEEIVIKNHVPALRGYNREEGMKSVYLEENVSIIDYVEGIRMMIKEGAIGGVDRHTVRNIKRFRTKQKPQVIILNTASGDVYSHHGSSWHWMAVKFEYDKDNRVQMTVVDSLSGDRMNHPILEQLYHLFVTVDLP
ncbi:hypothetical protein KKA53_04035 [Candidatus Dependentiae bacterium]|nr:hypothetical protein [Candidatus Dependentiae bacterium]